MGSKRAYEYENADKLGNYVRRRYRQLSNGALQLYFSLPYLEKGSLGLCKPITANYKDIGAASFKDASGLKKPLQELAGVLCEIHFGSPIKEDKKATQIRRYTLSELTSGELKTRMVDYTPVCAKQLAEGLREHPFTYGNTTECLPFWSVSRTGRIISRQPNVQGDSDVERIRNLCCGLNVGEVLFHLDIRQAEPSIIQQVADTFLAEAPYDLLSGIEGISRSNAKQRINSLAYSKSAVRILNHWSAEAQKVFASYAKAVDGYKDKLWLIGKPDSKKRRFIRTLGGTRIEAGRGERAHRGQIMNWHVQGTVADIVNATSQKIIELSEQRGWRYCFPVHDAVYVIGSPNHQDELQSILEHEARRLTLELKIKVEVFHPPSAVRKSKQRNAPLPV